jgi:hypothetical protein
VRSESPNNTPRSLSIATREEMIVAFGFLIISAGGVKDSRKIYQERVSKQSRNVGVSLNQRDNRLVECW